MNKQQTLISDLATDGLKRTIYVFVRTDLSLGQQMVQAAHAAAEASRRFYAPAHGIASLIVLAVPNLAALYKARNRMEDLELEHTLFFEPDWEMGHSALATRPVLDVERNIFKGWQLWKPKAAATEGALA